MSYILDALRKSDQMRRRGAAPTLLLGQAPPVAPKRPALLSYGLLALVLLAAGIAIGWLRPWAPEPVAPAQVAAEQPAEPEQEPAPLPRAEAAIAPQPEARGRSSAPAALPPAAPEAAAAAQAQAGIGSNARSAPPRAVAEQRAAAPAAEPAAAARRAAAEPVVIAMSELPLGIQQELPAMAITVHAYSGRAADRLVGINDRLLHEGEDVAPGLKLEQITPEGMILSYKGFRFRRGVH